MRILAISGSLRRESYNTALLREAAEVAPAGVELELYEGLELLPPYNEDVDGPEPPGEAIRLRAAIDGADGLLIATPEYNGSVPGQLKNAVDWASRPVRRGAVWGKPVAVVGATTGSYGAVWAQADLRRSLGIAGARVLEVELPLAKAHERFDDQGRLEDGQLRERLAEIVRELAAAAEPVAVAA
ncbi:MAG: NAD(P)H-dependent oxidoreductase [Thermoleophilia bacterium]|nr:NAD(P)H-dependent oxidoreductase [Thermoleophilia bacterium]